MNNTKINNTCKHGMMLGTCAICQGLVVPSGKLQAAWIILCDEAFDKDVKKDKMLDEKQWFKSNRKKMLKKFEDTWKTIPPYPTYPER